MYAGILILGAYLLTGMVIGSCVARDALRARVSHQKFGREFELKFAAFLVPFWLPGALFILFCRMGNKKR